MNNLFLITACLIGLNIVVYCLPFVLKFGATNAGSFQTFIETFYEDPKLVRRGEYYRMLTSTFLHANLLHLFLNMYNLFYLSSSVIEFLYILCFRLGIPGFVGAGFVALYLLSSLIPSVIKIFLLKNRDARPSLGASGAIFGLYGFLIAHILISGNFGAVLSVAVNLIILQLISKYAGDLDNYSHWAGIVTGLVFGFLSIAISLRLGV
jgi:rhomboid protease GluP